MCVVTFQVSDFDGASLIAEPFADRFELVEMPRLFVGNIYKNSCVQLGTLVSQLRVKGNGLSLHLYSHIQRLVYIGAENHIADRT